MTLTPNQQSLQNELTAAEVEHPPPPAYGEVYGQVDLSQNGLDTKAQVASDGRLNISICQRSKSLTNVLQEILKHRKDQDDHDPPKGDASKTGLGTSARNIPSLNIVIQVVGSRGDVQPFIALGKVLKQKYKHRVRLATHSTFKKFVEENGLEHFSIGGDPAELMAFMVKNPGLMPGMDSITSGDVGRRRKGMFEILQGCWRSCFELGDGTSLPTRSGSQDDDSSGFDAELAAHNNSSRPFVADAIIANPPSFAHIHCAEKLGIPLHLMFTMPWSPTQAFPHPLANIETTDIDPKLTNFVSYALVEMMTWQGLGDLINSFRERFLALEPISLMWAPGLATRLRIPYTYCWSPALIPKPRDWGSHIALSGFYFLPLANTFQPDEELESFLNAGEPPIYIGFGSIVVDDPGAMTDLIFEAVKLSGHRALVSEGWGGLGNNSLCKPDSVMMLGNVPHDWLFSRVSCVVHHGGAGTTAAGIALGKPTVVVPFFGDQPFWGSMVARAGAGPPPIPQKLLSAQNLAEAIGFALDETTQRKAQELGEKISHEDGVEQGIQSFHAQLKLDNLSCDLFPSKVAVWRLKRTKIKFSAFAASVLASKNLIGLDDLKLYRSREYEADTGPWDPISGGTAALLGTIGSMMMGAADFPVEIIRAMKANKSTKGKIDDVTKPIAGTDNATDTAPLISRSQSNSSTELCSENVGFPIATTPKNQQQPKVEAPISLDTALGAGKSIRRIVGAGIRSPMDFTLSIARGFHNAPKLYGDKSVRATQKVTDAQSGFKVAGTEFGLGFYDGITGLVSQPLNGAKSEGVAGFVKGFGKGIGGLILKPGAAIWSLPGYAFKGIYQEIRHRFGANVQNYIIAARTAQGLEEMSKASSHDTDQVLLAWDKMKLTLDPKVKDRIEQRGLTVQSPVSSRPSSTKSMVRRHGANVPSSPTEASSVNSESEALKIGDQEAEDTQRALRESLLPVLSEQEIYEGAMEKAIRASLEDAVPKSSAQEGCPSQGKGDLHYAGAQASSAGDLEASNDALGKQTQQNETTKTARDGSFVSSSDQSLAHRESSNKIASPSTDSVEIRSRLNMLDTEMNEEQQNLVLKYLQTYHNRDDIQQSSDKAELLSSISAAGGAAVGSSDEVVEISEVKKE